MATYSQGNKTKSKTKKPNQAVRKMKFLIAKSNIQRLQLQDIAIENGLQSEEEALSFLISEYRMKYR